MAFPTKFTHISLFFLTITALSGIWMRLYFVAPNAQTLPFEHILHGHSHMAILGWTFLAMFVLYVKLTWESMPKKKHAIAILYTILVVTLMMFIAFLYEGYATYSIILSVIHIFVEYWVIIFIWITLKYIPHMTRTLRLFMYASLLSLFLSTLGPFSLGAIAANGLRESPLFEMAIYFYLHFQYNGWLFFMLIGLFLFFLQKNKITYNEKWIQCSFWIYFISLFPAYFSAILWYDIGIGGYIAAFIGVIGQCIAILLLIGTIFPAYHSFHALFSKHMKISYIFVAFILLMKQFMEFGLLIPGFSSLIYETRSVIIGYLHLTLLGFITMFILNLYQSTQLLDETKKRVTYGIAIFLGGFVVQEVILFCSALFAWTNGWIIPYQNELLLSATILLLVGICSIWTTVCKQTK